MILHCLSPRFLVVLWIGFLFFQSSALFAANSVVFDFPLQEQKVTIPWVSAPPVEWEEVGGRRIELPLKALQKKTRFVLTVVFEERPGTAIRVWWEPNTPANQVPIVANLAEGITGWNQKTLILPSELTDRGGVLVFETAGAERVIQRVIAAVVEKGVLFTTENRASDALISLEGGVYRESDLGVTPQQVPPDAWFGNMIEAYLQESSESMRRGVEFGVEIRPAAPLAVLRFEVNGRGPAPEIWVNGKKLSGVSLEVPEFRSLGYVQPSAGSDFVYAGWRKGWVLLPKGILNLGENFFLFSSGEREDFLRHTRLEMRYEASPLPKASVENFDILQPLEEPLPSPVVESNGVEPVLPAWPTSATPAVPSTDLFRTSLK